MLSQESCVCQSNLKDWIWGFSTPHATNQEAIHPSGMPRGASIAVNPYDKIRVY